MRMEQIHQFGRSRGTYWWFHARHGRDQTPPLALSGPYADDRTGMSTLDSVMHGDLPPEQQDSPSRDPLRQGRRATNVAETSVTIDGIRPWWIAG